MPHVLILGGTGPAGILVVKQYFSKYPDGTAVLYARNPSKFPADITANKAVTLIKGELTDEVALSSTFEGKHVDAVCVSSSIHFQRSRSLMIPSFSLSSLSALGPIQSETPHFAEFYSSFIPIMHKYNSTRLIALSTPSAPDPQDKWALAPFLLVLLVKLLANQIWTDVVAYADVIRKESVKADIEYTIVRVPFLTNKEGKKPVAGYLGDGKVGVILSRYAYAEFAVDQIEGREWVNKSPALSSVPK